jgi:hypothetical protein
MSFLRDDKYVWIVTLIVYFIVVIVVCLLYAFTVWKDSTEPFAAPINIDIDYEPLNNNGKATENSASNAIVDKNIPPSPKDNATSTKTTAATNNTIPKNNQTEATDPKNQDIQSSYSQMLLISNQTKQDGYDTTTTLIEQNSTHKKTTTISKSTSYERELRLVQLSIIFGALGAAIHGIASLTVWVSNNKEQKSYFLWYISRPFIGAGLAVIVYLLLRASLLNSVTGLYPTMINDFGVAGLSALIGLMATQMIKKLRDVFDSLFGITKSKYEKGDDPQVTAEENLQLSTENKEIKEGDESLLIGIVKDNEGNPKKDAPVEFAIFDTNIASFNEKETPDGITDSNGIAVKRFQAKKEGHTSAAITAKDKELYAKIRLDVKARSVGIPPPTTTPPPTKRPPPS